MKEYRNMSKDEQAVWAVRFSEFLTNDYANVKAMGEGWKAAFERGLGLLEPFTISEQFVKNTRAAMDYDRRIQRLSYFVEELRKQVVESEGDVLNHTVQPMKRRVGRPTREEARAWNAEKSQMESEANSGKADAVMIIAGREPEPKAEPKPQPQKPDMGMEDMFGKSLPPAPIPEQSSPTRSLSDRGGEKTSSNLYTEVPRTERSTERNPVKKNQSPQAEPTAAERERFTRLQDIKHKLTPETRDMVDTVAMLRGRMATESELAKELALRGAKPEEVETHAQIAAECEKMVQQIYDKVDEELKKQTPSNPPLGEDNEANSPAHVSEGSPVGKDTQRSAEVKKKLHNYRTFFIRKDAKRTAARIERMDKIIAEMKAMGVATEEYELIRDNEKKALAKEKKTSVKGKNV